MRILDDPISSPAMSSPCDDIVVESYTEHVKNISEIHYSEKGCETNTFMCSIVQLFSSGIKDDAHPKHLSYTPPRASFYAHRCLLYDQSPGRAKTMNKQLLKLMPG